MRPLAISVAALLTIACATSCQIETRPVPGPPITNPDEALEVVVETLQYASPDANSVEVSSIDIEAVSFYFVRSVEFRSRVKIAWDEIGAVMINDGLDAAGDDPVTIRVSVKDNSRAARELTQAGTQRWGAPFSGPTEIELRGRPWGLARRFKRAMLLLTVEAQGGDSRLRPLPDSTSADGRFGHQRANGQRIPESDSGSPGAPGERPRGNPEDPIAPRELLEGKR